MGLLLKKSIMWCEQISTFDSWLFRLYLCSWKSTSADAECHHCKGRQSNLKCSSGKWVPDICFVAKIFL